MTAAPEHHTETAGSTEVHAIVMEREMAHAPEKVWRAITTSALMEDWLMSNDFKPEVGHAFTLRTEPVGAWNGVTECQVLEVEPPRRLVYTWNSTGGEGVETVVTWTLTATAKGAHVRMEQSGFRPDRPQNLQGATFGWRRFMFALEQRLDTL
jgi:uncharacterized protein YndB with AHSA1/START domain